MQHQGFSKIQLILNLLIELHREINVLALVTYVQLMVNKLISVTLSIYHIKQLEMTTNGPQKQGLQLWTSGFGGASYDIYVVTTV